MRSSTSYCQSAIFAKSANDASGLFAEIERVHVEQYCWGDDLPDIFQGVSLVVSSDTVYDPCLVAPLVKTIHMLLRAVPDAWAVVTYDQAIGREAAYAEWSRQAAEAFDSVEEVRSGDHGREFGQSEDKESVAVWLLHSATVAGNEC